MFKRYDSFLLGKFQRFSDKVFDYLGIDNFLLAKLLMGVYCALLVWDTSIALFFSKQEDGSTAWFLVDLVSVVILFLWWKGVIRVAEQYMENTTKGTLNPALLFFRGLRTIKIIILLFSIPDIVRGLSIVCDNSLPLKKHYLGLYLLCDYSEKIVSLLILYFISCQPKPPQRSKLRDLLDRFTVIRKPAFSQ